MELHQRVYRYKDNGILRLERHTIGYLSPESESRSVSPSLCHISKRYPGQATGGAGNATIVKGLLSDTMHGSADEIGN